MLPIQQSIKTELNRWGVVMKLSEVSIY